MYYTDPHIFLFDEYSYQIYQMDDFGNTFVVSNTFWYNPSSFDY